MAKPAPLQSADNISIADALILVSDVLKHLHSDNLHLQDQLGSSLGGGQRSLIEDLQILDRQAQVMLDLAACLSIIADANPAPLHGMPMSVETLFRLDATKDALPRDRGTSETPLAGDKTDLWI